MGGARREEEQALGLSTGRSSEGDEERSGLSVAPHPDAEHRRDPRVDGELGLIDGDSNDAFRWNVRFSRQGIPWFPNGSATLSVYNLDGFHSNGIGVRLSGMIPAYEGRLFVQPAIALRVARYDTDGAHGTFFEPVDQTVGAVDLSLRAQYRMSRSWSFAGGMSYALGEDENRFFLDIGATYRW